MVVPLMKDDYNSISEGSQFLIAWSLAHTNQETPGTETMQNSFVSGLFTLGKTGRMTPKKASTTLKIIKKDPEAERGKELCVSGQIVSIRYNRTGIGNFSTGPTSDELHGRH
jgi:hypothetical protein